jgi:RND family efflux transporter MFP subunit
MQSTIDSTQIADEDGQCPGPEIASRNIHGSNGQGSRIVTTRETRTMSDALLRGIVLRWLFCAGLTAAGCGKADVSVASNAVKALPTLEAEIVVVAPQVWPTMIRSHGSLIPDEVAVVGSRTEGRVDVVHIDLGDKVTMGQTLVTIRQAEFRLRLEQAEAQLLQTRSAVGLRPGDEISKLQPENAPPVLEQKAMWNEAKANMDRAHRLQDRKSITPAELEQIAAATEVAEARFKSALNGVHEKIALIGVREAELSLAREQLADTQILAPFDGLIQQKQVSPGSYVRVGDPVATVVRTESLRFRGTIPERFALDLSPGQSVQLQIESVKEPVMAEISRISPAVDLTSRSLLFEAVIDNSDARLRSGLFAEARIVTSAKATAIVIPASALVEFAGAEKVWKVVDGESREQQVLAGERRQNGVEILQGLKEGDVILRNGISGMTAKVKPIVLEEGVPNDLSGTLSSSPSKAM